MTADIPAAKAALAHLDLIDAETPVRAASRDFFWYSPVLKARLDHVTADFVVRPRTEAEVIEVLKTCYQHDVPVTTRGAGTGNYGQAMPFEGGCVLHLSRMTEVKEIAPGRVVVEPGCLLKDLDAACRETGQEIRMFSSTWATADSTLPCRRPSSADARAVAARARSAPRRATSSSARARFTAASCSS